MKKEYKFDDCINIGKLKFDFYLPENNTVIEFNGKQHYESVEYFGGEKMLHDQIKRDEIKKKYCIKNNINLIIIKYNDNIDLLNIQEIFK